MNCLAAWSILSLLLPFSVWCAYRAYASACQVDEVKRALQKEISTRELISDELGQARQAGFVAYLPKPVRPSQLYSGLVIPANEEVSQPAPAGESSRPLITRHTLVETPEGSSVSLLIVEDNEISQDVIMQQVKLLGFEADVVSSGYEALEALATRDFDAVLMDCQMSGIDGYETTRRIREREGAAKHTPVIALTAHALDGDREKCLAAGMDDYLVKPFEFAELQSVVGRWAMPHGSSESSTQRKTEDIPPVDLERLLCVSGGTHEGLREMFDTYLENMSGELLRLRTAVEAQSPADVESYAHSCAGACAICGITALVAPLRELEKLGRTGDLKSALELCICVEAEFARVREYLKEQLN